MLWLVLKDASHEIVSCNTHINKDGQHELWVTKTNDKSLLVHSSPNANETSEIKQAIDFAIESKDPVFRM